jgi:hypothetical protein
LFFWVAKEKFFSQLTKSGKSEDASGRKAKEICLKMEARDSRLVLPGPHVSEAENYSMTRYNDASIA